MPSRRFLSSIFISSSPLPPLLIADDTFDFDYFRLISPPLFFRLR